MSMFERSPELLESFRRGDHRTLEKVYLAYRPRIEAYLANLGRPHGLSRSMLADLRQEVFLRAFRESSRRSYDPRGRYGPYVMTIAHHCYVDHRRKRQHELLRADLDEGVARESAFVDPDDSFDPHLQRVVACYLARLPESLTRVYERRYVLGESQAVACEELGLTRSTLRTWESHLKRGLRKALLAGGAPAPALSGAGSSPEWKKNQPESSPTP